MSVVARHLMSMLIRSMAAFELKIQQVMGPQGAAFC